MKVPSSRMARAAMLLGAVAVSSASAITVSSPALAADLGTLTISPASGSVTDNPAFTSVDTSAACPTGYGTNVAVKVGPVGGPYSNLNRIGSENNYDAAPFTLTTNRSLATALGSAPADGSYEVVVECSGEVLGDNPDLFKAAITVSNGTWSVASAQPTTPPATDEPTTPPATDEPTTPPATDEPTATPTTDAPTA